MDAWAKRSAPEGGQSDSNKQKRTLAPKSSSPFATGLGPADNPPVTYDKAHEDRVRDYELKKMSLQLEKLKAEFEYVTLVNQEELQNHWRVYLTNVQSPRDPTQPIFGQAVLLDIFKNVFYTYLTAILSHDFLKEVLQKFNSGQHPNEEAHMCLDRVTRTINYWNKPSFFDSIELIRHRRKVINKDASGEARYAPHTLETLPQGGWLINFRKTTDAQPIITLLRETSRLLHIIRKLDQNIEGNCLPEPIQGFACYPNTSKINEEKVSLAAMTTHMRETGTFLYNTKQNSHIISAIKEVRQSGKPLAKGNDDAVKAAHLQNMRAKYAPPHSQSIFGNMASSSHDKTAGSSSDYKGGNKRGHKGKAEQQAKGYYNPNPQQQQYSTQQWEDNNWGGSYSHRKW